MWSAGYVSMYMQLKLSVFLYRPYIIDLESTNGTYVNNKRIDAARYVELKEKVNFCANSLFLIATTHISYTFLEWLRGANKSLE